MEARVPVRTAAVLTCLAVLSPSASAWAAEPTKVECITANENGQRLKREGKLAEARAELEVAMSASCPGAVREDSARLLAEIEQEQAARKKEEPAPTKTEETPQAPAVAIEDLDRQMRAATDQAGCDLARRVDSAPAWRLYREVFPIGACAQEASRRIAEIEASANAAPPHAPAPPPSAPPPVAPVPENTGWPAARIAGIAVGAAGLVAAGIGAGFGAIALGKQSDAEPHCPDGNKCDAEGVALRDEGLTAAHVSTGLFIAGAALVATGVVLVVTAPSEVEGEATASLTLAPLPAGLVLRGVW